MTVSDRIVRVGIIGAGEVTQVVHIPTFGYLSEFYKITYISDASEQTLAFVKNRLNGPSFTDVKLTTNPDELLESNDVDVVLVATSDEYHVPFAEKALKNDKFAFVEKPMALTFADANRLIEAEKTSKGKVFVGYMRRSAPALELAVKEVGGLEKIKFARIRDILGPNANFVNQSGTFPQKFDDFPPEAITDKQERSDAILKEALENDVGLTKITPKEQIFWRFLGGLGSHDLSVMRHVLGMPKGYIGAKATDMFFINALLDYGDYVVSYETGITNVPEFDAHIEVYGDNKIVKVKYDTPYVRGLPITLEIRENDNGVLVKKEILPTYEDPYTIQAKKLYQVVVNGESFKTTAVDALEDLKIFRGIVKSAASYSPQY